MANAVYVWNRLPQYALSDETTPYFLVEGHKPDVSHLRVFGCDAYAHLPDPKRPSFGVKAVKCIFVGYDSNSLSYIYYHKESLSFHKTGHIRFNEDLSTKDQLPTEDQLFILDLLNSSQSEFSTQNSSAVDLSFSEKSRSPGGSVLLKTRILDSQVFLPETAVNSETDNSGILFKTRVDLSENSSSRQEIESTFEQSNIQKNLEDNSGEILETNIGSDPISENSQQLMPEINVDHGSMTQSSGNNFSAHGPANIPAMEEAVTDSGRMQLRKNPKMSTRYNDYCMISVDDAINAMISAATVYFDATVIPEDVWLEFDNEIQCFLATDNPSYEETLIGPEAPMWSAAIERELNSLIDLGTWEVVHSLPPGRKAIGYKWVFKIKRNFDDTIAQYKARLTAKGFSQIAGVDFRDTFAPVARQTSLRLFFSLVVALVLLCNKSMSMQHFPMLIWRRISI